MSNMTFYVPVNDVEELKKLLPWVKVVGSPYISEEQISRALKESELTRVLRRLAIKSYQVTFPEEDDPTDLDLHANQDWAKAVAVYKELMKIDEERSL